MKEKHTIGKGTTGLNKTPLHSDYNEIHTIGNTELGNTCYPLDDKEIHAIRNTDLGNTSCTLSKRKCTQ